MLRLSVCPAESELSSGLGSVAQQHLMTGREELQGKGDKRGSQAWAPGVHLWPFLIFLKIEILHPCAHLFKSEAKTLP